MIGSIHINVSNTSGISGEQPAAVAANSGAPSFYSTVIEPTINGPSTRYFCAAAARAVAFAWYSATSAASVNVLASNFGYPVSLDTSIAIGIACTAIESLLKAPTVGLASAQVIEQPVNPERIVGQAIDSAFDQLPARMAREIASFPESSPELAAKYKTTVQQLEADRAQAASTLCLFVVLNSLKSAVDDHWDLHSRMKDAPAVNALARRLILEKLADHDFAANQDHWLSKGADALLESQPTYGLSQREYFALVGITDSFLRRVLSGHGKGESQADAAAVKCSSQLINARPGVERQSAFMKSNDSIAHAIECLFFAFDRHVRPTGAYGADMRRVSALVTLLENPERPQKTNHETDVLRRSAASWLDDQYARFSSRLNSVFGQFPAESRAAYRHVMLNAHLQKAGDVKTSTALNREPYASAREKLERVRQGVSRHGLIDMPTLKKYLQLGLNGLKTVIDNNQFVDLRLAIDDNRTGTPWNDRRLNIRIESLAGQRLLKHVRPEQREAVVQSLAGYGEKVVRLLKTQGTEIHSGKKYGGLSGKDSPLFVQRSTSESATPDIQYHTPRSDALLEWKMGVYQQIDTKNYASTQSVSNFHVWHNRVVLADYSTPYCAGVAAHELGHALDHALGRQLSVVFLPGIAYFSDKHAGIQNEFAKARMNNSGITAYAQTTSLEMFAESAAAFLNNGLGNESTFAKPVGPIMSRENLEDKHPVVAQFLDEVLRAPTKAIRAANTPLLGQ